MENNTRKRIMITVSLIAFLLICFVVSVNKAVKEKGKTAVNQIVQTVESSNTEVDRSEQTKIETTTENKFKELDENEYVDYVANEIERFAEENNLVVLRLDSRAPYLNFHLTTVEKVNGKLRKKVVSLEEAQQLYDLTKIELVNNLSQYYSKWKSHRYSYSIIGIFIEIPDKELLQTDFVCVQFNVEDYQNGKDNSDRRHDVRTLRSIR